MIEIPPGFFHQRLRKACYIIIYPTTIYLLIQNPVFAIGRFFGYGAGKYIDGDWDSMMATESEGNLVNEIKFFGAFLFGISSTYGAFFRRYHRSFITHFPIISTFIRLMFVFAIPIWWFYSLDFISFRVWHLELFTGFWYGLSEADLVHFLADMIWDDDSKRFEKYRPKKRR